MKSQTLPVKRRPVPKGVFRRLSAVTRSRKQRASAATAPVSEIDDDDGSSKISRALTIIFLIHIVAIGLIFFHQRFLDDRPAEQTATPKASTAKVASRAVLPRLSPDDKAYFVQKGDNWSRIAAAHGVDEAELRKVNAGAEIATGRMVIIPPKRIVAEEPPEVVQVREQATPAADPDRGLVPAVDIANAPKARLVRPQTSGAQAAASGASYVVQPGDSVWRIANRFNVSQDALMRVNGITDARKMRAGMTLRIP